MAKEPDGAAQRHDADRGHRPDPGEHQIGRQIFQEDPLNDRQKMPHRIGERQRLDEIGHVVDRGREARQDDGRHKKQEGSQDRLLLSARKC
jgi:hypothetical protein